MFAFSGADAQAAEKLNLGLGGYFIWAGGSGNSDAHDDNSAINMWAESEVNLRVGEHADGVLVTPQQTTISRCVNTVASQIRLFTREFQRKGLVAPMQHQ